VGKPDHWVWGEVASVEEQDDALDALARVQARHEDHELALRSLLDGIAAHRLNLERNAGKL
jgi:hypothetical protein